MADTKIGYQLNGKVFKAYHRFSNSNNQFLTNSKLATAYPGLEKMFSCRLCGAHFYSSHLLAEHFDDHFSPGNCGNCDQQVLLINSRYYYLHLHITSRCLEEIQQISPDVGDGSRPISNILAEVVIKEDVGYSLETYEEQPIESKELYENEGAFEDIKMLKEEPIASEEREGEDVEYIEEPDCFGESYVGDISILKLEDTSCGETSVPAISSNCTSITKSEGRRPERDDSVKLKSQSRPSKFEW